MPRKRAKIGGFTVAEALVATTIMGLVITLALAALAPGLQVTKQAENEIAAQREVGLVFDRLSAEMLHLDRATVTTAPETLSYLSDLPYSGNNPSIDDRLVDLNLESRIKTWTKNVILTLRDRKLWRQEYPYTRGRALSQISPDGLLLQANVQGVAQKVFASEIELFEAEAVGRSRVYIKLRSVFRKVDKPVSCELEFNLQMRAES